MKQSSRFALALWMLVSGLLGTPAPCHADSLVTLRPEVEVRRSAVRLSDIFVGVPADIDRDIAQAPGPCKQVVYGPQILARLADNYRLNWEAEEISGQTIDTTTITAACTRISTEAIKDAVLTKLKEEQGGRDRFFEIAFDNRAIEATLPASQKPDFDLKNFSYDSSNKRFRADLTAQTARGPYILPVSGRVFVKRNVPVLARRLEAGSTIGAVDLDWVQMPEERISADVITDLRQAVGREIKRDKAEGDILRSHDVVPPRLVLRGSTVMMRIETPFMVVTAQGKAQQDGAAGDTVRIMNTQSNRVIEGVVSGPGVVDIRMLSNRVASLQ